MSRNGKFKASAIFSLLEKKQEISIHDVAKACGVSGKNPADLRALQRLLAGLIRRGDLEAKGAARARTYARKQKAQTDTPTPPPPTLAIPSSAKSLSLLKYLSQDVRLRKPVGYNTALLKNYRPNHDFFLPAKSRSRLLALGTSGPAERPAGTYARNILERLLVDLAWNSSRLEGNTYSLLQTQQLIQLGTATEGKNAEETQMILNHKAAIEFMVNEAAGLEISKHVICNIHALLSENLLGSSNACGRIRFHPVKIGASTYLPLEGHRDLVHHLDLFVTKARAIQDPFEQSFFSLVHLSYLQAFEDVNKRTSRMAANIPLIRENLKPLSFADVPEEDYLKGLLGVYEKNDASLMVELYAWAYARSAEKYSAVQQSMGGANLLKLKYRDRVREIIKMIITTNIIGRKIPKTIVDRLEGTATPKRDAENLGPLIEDEIRNLHDGNIARYQISPAEFRSWLQTKEVEEKELKRIRGKK